MLARSCCHSRAWPARGIPDYFRRTADMRDRSYYVYFMSSLSRTLYVGVSNDLERRVQEHKAGTPGSFTARYNVNRLGYFEEFSDINQAIAREKEIKHMTRARKSKLVESMNPQWLDLSESWLGN